MSTPRRSQILEPDTLDGLVVKDDVAGLKALILHLATLTLLAVGSVVLPSLLAWASWLGYSVVLIFVFCPLHECIHGTAFASNRLNRWVAIVFGFLLFLPPGYFRCFHLAHHRFTQIPDFDPELGSPKPGTRWEYLRHVSGLSYWTEQCRTLVNYTMGRTDDFVPVNRAKEIVREVRIFLILYLTLVILSLFFSSSVLWWYWWLPVMVAQPFLRLFLLAEHTGCPEVPDMFENTRTTLTIPIMQFLCWNMNFHTVHHAYAGIPFHRLPEANRLLADNLVHVGHGYFQVSRAIFHQRTAG